MGKRKRGAQPPPGDDHPTSGSEESAEPKVHVGRDVLAGSPDIFAKSSAGETPAADTTDSPERPEPSESEAMVPAEVTAPAEARSEEMPPAVEAEPALPPEFAPVAPVAAPAAARRGQRWGSSTALGIVLVVVGAFFLVIRVLNVDLSNYGWPLFIIIPGLTLIVVGFASLGTGALIPGGILTMVGLILAYQNSTGDWASWAIAWPWVAPGGVGLGMYLQGLRNRDVELLKQGRTLLFIALVIFLVLFVVFESILHISGFDYGWFDKAALPALLILLGLVLLMRSLGRSRQTP
jgi:hypothetical protein